MQNQQGRNNGEENPKLQRGSKSSSPQNYVVDNFRLSLKLYFLPLILLLSVGLFSCGNPPTPKPEENSSERKNTDSQLTFFGVALEQFDEQGKPIWKVQAKQAKYTKEQEIGEAKNPQGELYQDGQVVYTIKAETADIKQDGKQLFLKGKIIAEDPRNGVILRGNELEWRPEEDLLIVRNQLNGTHKQLQAVAQEARVKTREQRVDFSGKVVAISADPALQVKTERLTWQVKTEKLIGDRPIEINRFQDNKITDRAKGNSAEINLKTKTVTLQPNAKLELLAPPMEITSNSMTWNISQETVKTNAPVRVFHQSENVTVTGNKAEMKIPEKIVYLTGNVNAVGKNKQSLKSNQLTWNLDQKLLSAKGNVFYTQIQPPLKFQGTTAVGNLETENIVVKGGGSGNRVITEIIPQE
ncbi:MAG: LPS export ABC transporter periplasmic protein LptC [Nostocales cyanobacterium]|nr:MAG: LPS export ABC transporter periplasmic protein LptC [Nostocales cyanobacterium]TAF13528.1 MAG: LPS export ABC transporter periplasmic protein LptC [Nostocales cyanobacterium]